MASLVVAGAAAAMGRLADKFHSRDKLPPAEPGCELSADSVSSAGPHLPHKAMSAVSLPTYLPARTRSVKSEGELDGCSVCSPGSDASADGDDADGASDSADHGVANLRDIAQLHSPDTVRPGRMFRCSQFHSVELRKRLGIKTVLDLRKTGKACQGFGAKSKVVAHPEWTWTRAKNLVPDRKPPRCPICEAALNKHCAEEHHVEVYHIDFCTSQFKYAVFTSIPFGSAAHAVITKLAGRNPEGPMANVVADPHKLGYGKLYILFLEHAKLSILRAFRLLAEDENYPMMVHCIHGKDRTGILVMLTLRTCGFPFDKILNDYMLSSQCMQLWCGKRPALDPSLCTAGVLSVERRYMMEAVDHVRSKYGDVPQYLASCGVDERMQQEVRHNLLVNPELPPGTFERKRAARR